MRGESRGGFRLTAGLADTADCQLSLRLDDTAALEQLLRLRLGYRELLAVERRGDGRSTFASDALAAGVSVFQLARVMGTSVRMIERHYGAMLDGSGAEIAGRLDALDAQRHDDDEATADEG
jgi:hypothetical protein